VARSAPAAAKPAIAPPSAATALDAAVGQLGRDFRGDLGIAIRDVQTGWTSHYRGLDYFPQQSVSKLWVSLTALRQADERRLDLARPLTMTAKDLTLFHQPIRALVTRPGGYRTTSAELMVRALTQSDNCANDRLLREVGGSDAVRETLQAKAVAGIRFGPGEKKLQASIAGLGPDEWTGGGGFYSARDALLEERRQAAFNAYVANPVDGATPLGVADALARLHSGELLSPGSTARMLEIMGQTRTGALRLKSGLKPGWTLSHKTGTGQVLGDEQAGYNDVGILTSPEGRSYVLAVMIGRTSQPLPRRSELMQNVVAAAIDYDRALVSSAQP
jgi:beta-lactamase class A